MPGDLGRRLGEIWRVLRPPGLLQVTVLSTRDANYGIGRAIAPDTFVVDHVERKGPPALLRRSIRLVGLIQFLLGGATGAPIGVELLAGPHRQPCVFQWAPG